MLIAGPARRRFIHNPNLRSVRVHYEAIPKDHPTLPAAEHALEKIVRVLVQLNGCRASIVPCLHRAERGLQDLPVVLHATLLDVEVLEMLHLMNSAIPVHLYIGDPLTTGTPFDAYSPEKLVIPSELRPGDPIFCASTERVTVFTAYLHLPDDGALYGLTAGQAVVPQAGFLPHPHLLPRPDKHQRRMRSSQLALQPLGCPLSNPAVQIVERAIELMAVQRAMLSAATSPAGSDGATNERHAARKRQHDLERVILQDSLARPHEYDVGQACAAEALIRPCNSSSHGGSATRPAPRGKDKECDHTHLLSWALMRMSSKACDNAVTLRAHPGRLECGTAVAMQVNDPNLERPLGPYRDGVVNGAPASVVLGGYVAREWAVFPAAGKGVRFAVRGDAGALVTAVGREGERDGGTSTPVAILYAIPERGPYGLVTSLTTIMRRIRDVTGLQLRFQGSWWRDGYG
ncbi:hypothetical protein TRAPUB_3343 [Trametes pubescens]|uniref:Uncharacterized protein n=1 Tax=Trametes pubescens TaxID=154538 RepID=A0A1M2VDZ6_TRAPU|nr:hypothetical protein TRAPUB_3343 [Trametes pubescens]